MLKQTTSLKQLSKQRKSQEMREVAEVIRDENKYGKQEINTINSNKIVSKA